MSYDISLAIDTGKGPLCDVIEIGNYTSNVGPMWRDALQGRLLREFHGSPCSEAAGPLAEAVKRMENEPERYKLMEPSNGWGDYDGALTYLRRLAEMCAEHPKCYIQIYA